MLRGKVSTSATARPVGRYFPPVLHRVFFFAILMTAFGSSWYLLAPDDSRLLWHRLPIALACVSLLAASLHDAYPAQRRAFGTAIGLYLLAKLCELADGAVFGALHAVSGHTLKHLLATLAALALSRTMAALR